MKRGIVITTDIEINLEKKSFKYKSTFNQKSIRYGLLYLDEICVAQDSFIVTQLPDDMQQLKKEKILTENITRSNLTGGFDFAKHTLDSYFQTFSMLNDLKDESWCLNKEFKIVNSDIPFIENSGETLNFLNSLPVPAEDFPLGDIYEFRIKRNDDRLALMNSIDQLRLSVLSSDDKETALKMGLLEVEKNLIAMNRLLKETKRGFYLTDFSLDYSTTDMMEIFKQTYKESETAGLDKLSSFFAGIGIALASGFNIKGGYRYKQAKSNSPYFYATEVAHKFNT